MDGTRAQNKGKKKERGGGRLEGEEGRTVRGRKA